MRVLMLGWEFPPHISGGLGTACLGLTRGLARQGVEVVFVVPRAHGDEDSRYATVIGAGDVPIPLSPPSSGAAPAAGSEAADDALGGITTLGLDDASAAELAGLAVRLRFRPVDSPLVPYLTPERYAERVAALRTAADVLPGSRGGGKGAPDRDTASTGDDTDAGTGAALPFSGEYGPDLMSEVGRYARVVARIAADEEFDVVHAHDWMTFPAGLVAARLRRKPLVAHLHASEYDRSGENVNPAVRDIEQMGLAAADRVICVSHFLAGLVRRRYGIGEDRITVVHNAVNQADDADAGHLDARRRLRSMSEPVVLFLGRVTFQKGPDYFLQAAARVLRLEPHVRFVISGSGDMLPQVIEQAAALGIARNVHFTGFLRGRDVERMYAMADIYVMPSVSEPFGISPLEAIANNVPVILSNQSGVSEVVRHALKVDFWDVDDMANKILALLRYDALREQLRGDASEEVRQLSWESSGEKLRDLYAEICAPSTPATPEGTAP